MSGYREMMWILTWTEPPPRSCRRFENVATLEIMNTNWIWTIVGILLIVALLIWIF